MSDAEKKAMEVEIMKVTNKTQIDMMSAWNEQEKQFQGFVNEHEGTASDLAQLGWVGKLLIGLRGLQRPVWGFGTLYLDYQVLSGGWNLTSFNLDGINQAWPIVLLINGVVLVFLFGERAMKNLAPLLNSLFSKK